MKTLSDNQKRALKRAVKERNSLWLDKLAMYAEDRREIDKYAVDGKVGISWQHIDCDMCRTTGVAVIPANVVHFKTWLTKFYDNAEGPTDWSITKPREQAPTFRDLIAEAHENGHPHLVMM